jgi:hypothetical protein
MSSFGSELYAEDDRSFGRESGVVVTPPSPAGKEEKATGAERNETRRRKE